MRVKTRRGKQPLIVVLEKYEKAPFEELMPMGLLMSGMNGMKNMGEWKRGYYKVGILLLFWSERRLTRHCRGN